MVGISLTSGWGEPIDPHSQADIDAAERYMQFHLGWFANPIYRGDYPEVMKNYVGKPQEPAMTRTNHAITTCNSGIPLTNMNLSQL